jgi:hypothetical protein
MGSEKFTTITIGVADPDPYVLGLPDPLARCTDPDPDPSIK